MVAVASECGILIVLYRVARLTVLISGLSNVKKLKALQFHPLT